MPRDLPRGRDSEWDPSASLDRAPGGGGLGSRGAGLPEPFFPCLTTLHARTVQALKRPGVPLRKGAQRNPSP